MSNKLADSIVRASIAFLLGFILTSVLLFFVSGCGYRQAFRTHCHLHGQMCDNLFGVDQYEIDSEQDKRLAGLEDSVDNLSKEVESLKTSMDLAINDVKNLQSLYASNQILLQLLQDSASNHSDTLEQLQNQLSYLDSKIQYQNTVIAGMQININNLASSDSVESYYDFCGNKPGYFNEVGLKLKSGKILAYFENGPNRFLTILQKNTGYVTTDGTRCFFQMDSNGYIINEHY